MKKLLSIFALFFSVTSFACNSLIDEKLRILDSTESESLCKYEGDVLLIVNVATLTIKRTSPSYLQRLSDSVESSILSFSSIKELQAKLVTEKNKANMDNSFFMVCDYNLAYRCNCKN